MMNAEQRPIFRTALLRVLETNNTRFGLEVPAMSLALGRFGFPGPNPEDVKDEIAYLEGKGLVEEVLKKINREHRAWRISTEGLAFLDAGG
jgi:hypothetical protein